MRRKKVTMLDIATAVGVSQPTVSVILNGSDSIQVSEDTRQKVLSKARELGYRIKAVPHGFNHPRIAFVVNSLNMHDPFITALSSAKVRAWERDAVLVVFDYEDNEELKQAIYNEIRNGRFSGLIHASNTPKEVSVSEVCEAKKRVLLNCQDPINQEIPAIITADYMGGYRACEHLIQQGHRRIGMVTGEAWSLSSIARVNGYRQAMINHDLPIDEACIQPGNWSVKQSYKATEHLLQQPVRPDAIFCASDLMALGAYQAIHRAGLAIPEDIAVMGYDNQLLANELTPSLSSVELPYDEMGRLAVDRVMDASPSELPVTKVEGDVFVRESTA